jgi:hypothetical protein
MLDAALEKFDTHDFTTDGSVELLYMRKPQAEIERDLKKKS